MAVSKDNDHTKHRKRVRERFRKNGFDGFLDYEILEMLLFYSIPVIDTKPIAKKLLKEYKTIANVLNAPTKELEKIDGIGEVTSTFLTMLPKAFEIYEKSKWTKKDCLDSVDAMGKYAVSLLRNKKKEEFALICVDAKMRVHWSGIVVKGTVDATEAYPREVLDVVIKEKATKVIFVHNHPSGTLAPSLADRKTTEILVEWLKGIRVEVLDHIIVSGKRYFSMKEMGFKF